MAGTSRATEGVATVARPEQVLVDLRVDVARRLASRESRWVAGRVVAQALEFVAWIVFARRLGSEDLGVLTVAVLVARYAGLVADWGATFRGPRDVARHGADSPAVAALVRRRERLSVALTVPFAAGVVLVTGQVGLVVVAAALVARGMNRDWISLGAQRYARALIPALVQPAVMFAGALVVSSLIGAAVVIAVASVAWLAVSIALHPVRARASAVLEPVDGWYARFAIADQVVASSDSLLLVAIRSAREAGIYSAVYRFPNAWMIVVGLAVSAMLPGVTRRVVDDPASYPAMRRRALRFAAVGAAVVAAGSVAVAIVGPLLLGDEYRDGRVPLAILLAGAVVLTAHAPLRPLYAAVGSDRALALVTSGVALANVAGNLLVIPAYGMVGAATTTLLAQVALFAFTFVATKRFAVRREQAA